MDRQKIFSMWESEELDRLVSEKVMGYSIYHYDKDIEDRCFYMLVDEIFETVANDKPWNLRNGERKTEVEAWNDCPVFSEDVGMAMKVERKIHSMDWAVQHSYLLALHEISGEYSEMNLKDIFNMMQAAPIDRCKAALIAVLEL